MKVNVYEADGPLLDYLVAECENNLGFGVEGVYNGVLALWANKDHTRDFHVAYSSDPAQAYPIIYREQIATCCTNRTLPAWQASAYAEWVRASANNPIVAAMRVHVLMQRCWRITHTDPIIEINDDLYYQLTK